MKTDLLNFTGQIGFITGAATGIGRTTAVDFAKQGATLVCVDNNESAGQETLRMVKEYSPKSIFVKADVSKADQVKAAVDTTVSQFGRIDFAYNNAGIEGTPGPIQDLTDENFDRVIQINLKGVWNCMRYQIPLMLKQKKGSIVNCSSIAGLVGFQNSAHYVASKHAVIGMTKTAALELAKTGVRVNVVCPGVIQTPMIDRFVQGDETKRQALTLGEPMGRVGEPREISSAVMWLSSDGASFVTGHALTVDGGWVAQ